MALKCREFILFITRRTISAKGSGVQNLPMESEHPIPIFLIHRDRFVRDLLPGALDLREEVSVVGYSKNVDDAIDHFADSDLAKKVDVILFDFTLDRSSELIELQKLRNLLPRVRFVAYGLKDPKDALPFLRADVRSYVPPNPHLTEVVQAVMRRTNLTPEMFDALIEAVASMEPQPPEEKLTPQQLKVLQFMSKGLSYQEIATDMDVKIATIRSHAREILRKLGVTNRLAALHRAVQVGWLPRSIEIA